MGGPRGHAPGRPPRGCFSLLISSCHYHPFGFSSHFYLSSFSFFLGFSTNISSSHCTLFSFFFSFPSSLILFSISYLLLFAFLVGIIIFYHHPLPLSSVISSFPSASFIPTFFLFSFSFRCLSPTYILSSFLPLLSFFLLKFFSLSHPKMQGKGCMT